ncbi:sodium:solute symporter family transporter [Planctomicrobium sp. SH661]|uniref:sodium:solute symporter family transporter n=1 Tax=Planctomicrobium sp. SH661 TaxID=3448124 RepID=UPI003F5C0D86
MQTIDWLFLVIYLGGLTGIGVYFSRRQKSVGDFLKGDEQVSWLAVGLSLMAALNSGMDYIQTPAIVFAFGMVYVALVFTWFPLYPWVMYVTVPFYRRLGVISAYEYLEQRFSLGVRLIASGIFILWRISWMGMALYIPCLAIQGTTGQQVSISTMAVILGLVVTVYTMLGGMQAVIWTDTIQSLVMFAGLAVTLGSIAANVPGGMEAVFAKAIESGRWRLVADVPGWESLSWPEAIIRTMTTEITLWGTLIFIMIGRMAMYTADQVAVQRFQTIDSLKKARNAFIVSGIADVIWMTVLGFVGLALFAYAQVHPLPEGMKNDAILPYFMSKHFIAGLTGLVVASILAASLSSVDAALNSTTSILVVDFYHRWWKGNTGPIETGTGETQRQLVRVSRGFNLLLGVLMIGVASSVEQLGEVYTVGNKLFGAFFGVIFGIFFLGMFTRRATSLGVLVGAVAGLATSSFFSFFSELKFLHQFVESTAGTPAVRFMQQISWQWPPLFGIGVTLLIGFLCSCLLPRIGSGAPFTYWEVMKLPERNGTAS